LSIDEVIQVIRSSDEAEEARTRLKQVFDLSDEQAEYILELRLRRLTKFSKIELDAEADKLREEIVELERILADDAVLRGLVAEEMAEVARVYGDDRRTELRTETEEVRPVSAAKAASVSAELADTECFITLTASGLLARSDSSEAPAPGTKRKKHDAVATRIATSTRKDLGFVTTSGRMLRIHVGDIPASGEAFDPSTGVKVHEFLGLKNERLLGVFDISTDSELLLGTRDGIVKRVLADYPAKDDFELIALKDGDELVGASKADEATECIFISSDAQLLRFDAKVLRAQGRAASGVAGINLAEGARAIFFGTVVSFDSATVITAANSSEALAGTDSGSIKQTPLSEFPAKGRATGGVRAHKFVRNEDQLYFAAIESNEALALASDGKPIELPEAAKRDASGTQTGSFIASAGSR